MHGLRNTSILLPACRIHNRGGTVPRVDVGARSMAGTIALTGSHRAGMTSLRNTISSTLALAALLAAAATLSLATAAMARPATCLEACAPAATFTTVAHPAHTAAWHHQAPGRAAHPRAHHRHASRASRALGVTTTRPQPLSPPRQRPEHRAALPRVSSGGRTHAGPRAGDRGLAALPGLHSLPTPAARALDADQIQLNERQPGLDHPGRGPPRTGPFTSLPPCFAGGLPPFLPSTAPRSLVQPGSSCASRLGRGIRAASALARTASSYGRNPFPEPLQSCSCADRPEGAAAFGLMPSVGGFS